MAFDDTPDSLFAGYDYSGDVLKIPLASLANWLTAADADVSTGSARKILRALSARGFDWYQGLASVDKPTAISVSITTTPMPTSSPTYPGTIKETVSASFYLNYSDRTVADEAT